MFVLGHPRPRHLAVAVVDDSIALMVPRMPFGHKVQGSVSQSPLRMDEPGVDGATVENMVIADCKRFLQKHTFHAMTRYKRSKSQYNVCKTRC